MTTELVHTGPVAQEPDPTWAVTLRNERTGRDAQHLSASWIAGVGLRIDGHDLGPGTAMVSDDGEYEWTYVIPEASIPELLRRLGEHPDADLRRVLDDWTGLRSYEVERLAADLRTSFSSWP
jgi:hypothetical protein